MDAVAEKEPRMKDIYRDIHGALNNLRIIDDRIITLNEAIGRIEKPEEPIEPPKPLYDFEEIEKLSILERVRWLNSLSEVVQAKLSDAVERLSHLV